jgi:hypothetical protein
MATSPPAAGSGRPAEIRGEPGTTVHNASRTSDQDGPEPGTSRGGALGVNGKRDERSDGERTGPKRRRGPR